MIGTKFKQNTIAIVYDFDGTLSPQPMQEYTILPLINEDPDNFWQECTSVAKKQKADDMLTYMRLLIAKANDKKIPFNKTKLKDLAKKIEYFEGVEDSWFDRINTYIKKKSNNQVTIEHYIISSGLKDILNGIIIKKYFKKIFACEYYFDHYGAAKFPTVVINDTVKTQYLFRINKGILDINQTINTYTPNKDRAIPFTNMIYIGDGLTDVPCMTVIKKEGGYAMAVHQEKKEAIKICKDLMQANRIDYYAKADYTQNKELEKKVLLLIDVIIANIAVNKEKFNLITTKK